MGAAVAHFGIRYTNDLTDEFSEYVVDSVDLLNLQLASHDMSFPEGPMHEVSALG